MDEGVPNFECNQSRFGVKVDENLKKICWKLRWRDLKDVDGSGWKKWMKVEENMDDCRWKMDEKVDESINIGWK